MRMPCVRGLPRIAFCLLAFVTPAAAESLVEGSVKLGHADWAAADVIAFTASEGTQIVFSDQPFDREAITADGRIDDFDIMRHSGNSLTMILGSDGPDMCLHMQTRTADSLISGSSCQSGFPPAIGIDSQSADRVAGGMDWEGDAGEFVKLRFDVAVQSEEALRAGAETLPPDGGEPGAAVRAHFAALAAGDYEGLKVISHPEARAMMEEAEADGDHMEIFDFLREIAPKNVVVTGGIVMGDRAEVMFEAEEDGSPVQGTAEVLRFEEKWYVRGTTIRG